MTDAPSSPPRGVRPAHRLAAWSVHLFTASGAIVALLALQAIHEGHYTRAFWWMAVALAIDSADGAVARALAVKTVLPDFDGARLDDLVDYLNYTVVPVTLIYAAGRLPPAVALPVAAGVLVASALGFCQTEAKTSDGYFKGFPSYWNVVVFYLFALDTAPWLTAATLAAFAMLVFVPVYYVYPSRTPRLRPLTIALTVAWGACVLVALADLATPPRGLLLSSLLYPAYYLGLSIYLTLTRARGRGFTA